eukprot:40519_1
MGGCLDVYGHWKLKRYHIRNILKLIILDFFLPNDGDGKKDSFASGLWEASMESFDNLFETIAEIRGVKKKKKFKKRFNELQHADNQKQQIIATLKSEMLGVKNKNAEQSSEINTLQNENKELNAINNKKTIQINEYEKQMVEQKTLIESFKKDKIVVEKSNSEKTTQIAIVTELMNKLKGECKSLNNRINILENEQKEYELNINKLKEENKKLRLLNIDTNKYKQWA